MELDHILLAVRDLDHAAEHFEREHGLTSYAGGVHTRWGTANRIVPLGDSYLELIAVVDDRTAAATDVGRFVMSGASANGSPIGWAVRPDDLDTTARRLGLPVQDGSRERADGGTVRWRMAGIEAAVSEPQLPWFISWTDHATYPGRPRRRSTPESSTSSSKATPRRSTPGWDRTHSHSLCARATGVTAIVLQGQRGAIRLGREPTL